MTDTPAPPEPPQPPQPPPVPERLTVLGHVPRLSAALAKFQATLPHIDKDSTADAGTYSYDYAALDAVSAKVMPLLGENGLAFASFPTMFSGRFVLIYSLLHESGERLDGIYPLSDRGTPQQRGSEITYARRYTLLAVTGVAPGGEDDDGAAAEAGENGQEPARQPAQQARKPRTRTRQTEVSKPAPPSPDGPLGAHAGSITEPQLKKLGAQFSGMGFTNAERMERLAAAGKIVGRDLGSASDLSKTEASKLIDVLERCGTRDNLMVLLATGELPGGDTNG